MEGQSNISKKEMLIAGILGFLGGQNMYILLPIMLLLTWFFLYRKNKNNKIWIFFTIGVVISLVTTIFFAGIAYVYLSQFVK